MINAIEIADTLVAALNAGEFSTEFSAVRKIRPIYETQDLANIKVTVVPRGIDVGFYSREASQFDHTVNVMVQKHLSGDVDAIIESVLSLVMDIVAFLRNRNLPGIGAKWVKTVVDPLMFEEHLVQQSVSTSIISVTYKVLE